jgi:hypothetical protein
MKAGRTLSRKNEDALTQACELLRECADRDDVPRAAKAIVREALGLVQGVLDQLPKPTTDQPEGGDPAESGPTTETGVTGAGLTETGLVETARILREVLAGDLDTIERYRDFNRRLHAALDLRQRALDDAEMEAICAEFGL